MMAPSKLGQREFEYLGQNGKTERIQAALGQGIDIFTKHLNACVEAWEKYHYLARKSYKPDFLKSDLKTWESRHLDPDGGTKEIQWRVNQGIDIF